MFATTSSGHREHVQVSKESRTLQTLAMGSKVAKLTQSTVTTTEVWLGLSYADAQTVCTASESSTLSGVTRSYLGTAKLTMQYGTSTYWVINEGCWGTKVTSQLSRMGDTNCYQVTRTTQESTVQGYGGELELL